MKTFLLIGLDPDGIDYSAPNVPKGMTAAKLFDAIAHTQAQFATRGDHLDNCIVRLDGSAEGPVTAQIARVTYDGFLIGGGLRQDASVELLERILDSLREHAPHAPVGFVVLPDGSLTAVARMLSRADESRVNDNGG